MSDLRDRITGVVEMRLGDVANNPRNPKTHPARQAEALHGVVREVGWAGVPLAYYSARNGGRLTFVDGHLRAAQFPDATVRVAVTDLDDAEADLLLLTFDPLAQMAEVEKEKAAALFGDVQAQDAAVDQLLKELAALAGVDSALDPDKHTVDPAYLTDKAEEAQQRWGVQLGDVWRIGPHALTCGDCTDGAAWARLLAAVGVDKVNLAFTSPPYAMQRAKQYGGIPADKYVDWWAGVQAQVKARLAADGSFFVNIKPHTENGQRSLYVLDLVAAMVRRWGWCYIDEFQWVHNGYPGKFTGRFKNQFEPVFQFAGVDGELALPLEEAEAVQHFALQVASGLAFNADGVLAGHKGGKDTRAEKRIVGGEASFAKDYIEASGDGNFSYYRHLRGARPGNVIKCAAGSLGGKHAAGFPARLPEFFIRAFSFLGDVVCDPFLGAATTIVAAHRNHRIGVGIELLPKYCALCLDRLAAETGATPEKALAGA